ncbi:MAG: stage III sporulation protein AA [Clostridia bacterium]|nr:stage III sporulation protein AA [Clostridia bacterium]
MNSILKYFPVTIKEILEKEITEVNDFVEEIRIRANKPIIIKFNKKEKIIKYFVSSEEILKTLQLVCENSIYSYQHQIADGFVTIVGGHRVGVAGSCVIENGKVININYINSLNFRIARQIKGISREVLRYILDLDQNTILNTLIVSPPGVGKTTLLKDITKQISSGIKLLKFKGLNVGIVDERGEIAALYKGVAQNDIGIKTDVMDNVSKAIGIKMLIRSMTPQVIIADEIGKEEDIDAINYALCSGCKGIFTAHGKKMKDLYLNEVLKKMIEGNIFELILFLDSKEKGKLEEVYLLNKNNMKYEKYEINVKEGTNILHDWIEERKLNDFYKIF